MPWIESHQELRDHPKLKGLARRLGISKVTAIGHLHCLWWWAMSYAKDGCLSRYDYRAIAEGAEWEDDPALFVDALLKEGFFDDAPLRIHDWQDFAGKLIDRRAANAERMRETRATHVQTRDDARVGLPYLTVPNLTEPHEQTEVVVPTMSPPATKRVFPPSIERYPAAFEAFWKAYPERPGNPKKPAYQKWLMRTRAGISPKALEQAAANFSIWCEDNGKTGTELVPHAVTFLNQARDEEFAKGVPPTRAPPVNGHQRPSTFDAIDRAAERLKGIQK